MPFIGSYNGAMRLLSSIENGNCEGSCKSTWIRNFKYALKTKSNPLKLNTQQRKNLTKKIKSLSGRKKNKKNKTRKN